MHTITILIKTSHRSRLTNEMLGSLMQVANNGPEVSNSNEIIDKTVEKWMSLKTRRKFPVYHEGQTRTLTKVSKPIVVDAGMQTDVQHQGTSSQMVQTDNPETDIEAQTGVTGLKRLMKAMGFDSGAIQESDSESESECDDFYF